MEIDPNFEKLPEFHYGQSPRNLPREHSIVSPNGSNEASSLLVSAAVGDAITDGSSESSLPFAKASDNVKAPTTPTHTTTPTSTLTPTPTAKVRVVPYDPEAKPERLGRPRKHITKLPSPPESSSTQNYNEAMMSKFRFDHQPVEGPGSRGGKGTPRVTKGLVTSSRSIGKPKQQSVLNFSPVPKPTPKSGPAPTLDTHQAAPGKSSSIDDALNKENQHPKKMLLSKGPRATPMKSPSPSQPPSTSRKDHGQSISIGISRAAPPVKKSSKTSKTLPSPLVPISLMSDAHRSNFGVSVEKSNPLALGYPVKESPYAESIVFLVSFLLKFKQLVPLEANLGPLDFEMGLSLPKPGLGQPPKDDSSAEAYDANYVSKEMDALFKKLLGLVLNRKKEVQSSTSAISELKPQTNKLGMPSEWKKLEPLEVESCDAGSPVYPAHPELLMDAFPKVESDYVTVFNPFYDSNFESKGLPALLPHDRLILLQTLARWSLTRSEAIKGYLVPNILAQELPGEKDTYYAARSVIYGFQNCHDAKSQAEKKLSKMKSSEENLKYVDPTSDPSSHSMSLRLLDLVAGDLDFEGGLFYLCRMSDENTGGLGSVKKMSSAFKGSDSTIGGPRSSSFKLYVQDVKGMLEYDSARYGVQFDAEGNEIRSNKIDAKETTNSFWFEVASDCDELNDFIAFLGDKIQETRFESRELSFCKASRRLHAYLSEISPLLQRQEELSTTSRSKRRRLDRGASSSNSTRYTDSFGNPYTWIDDDRSDEEYAEDEVDNLDDNLDNDNDNNDDDDKEYID
ncbi:uncharacterized protein LODBEIA_P36770 [Lodderomyces beijingensis]|uniref:WHIM1 domain-containing protein n=1 Tax=Lodderomyces beijingensis TaxID=1775926 RepID=A0ABP0ZP57_9ASCO